MFFYLYILQSKKDNHYYIGSTKDLRKRLKEHNGGKVKSTKSRIPFILIYYEAFLSEKDARLRESELKNDRRKKKRLLNRLKNSSLPPFSDI